MSTGQMLITRHASDKLQEIVAQMQEVSLIAAERVRNRIIHKVHLIEHHPLQGSKRIEFSGMEGHFRMAEVLNYRIFYCVEEDRIVIIDILMDKEVAKA